MSWLEAVARLFDPLGISYYPETARYFDSLILEEPIGYRHRPGLSGTYYGVPVTINSQGLRDREVADKVPGEFRILAMGDSVPFGIGSRQEDTYPSQLEALLNQKYPGRQFRTLNMGVPSYNTEQEKIQLLTTGLPLKPDAVIRIPFIREMLEVVARRERFPLVDLQREMDPRWAGQDERLFHNSVTDNHPSLLGNRALAVLMAESMEKLKVLGR